MTVIIAALLVNADCSRRWLFASRNGACPEWVFEQPVAPPTSSFATIIEPASMRARAAHDPDRCCGPCRRVPLTLSAIAKST